MEIISAFQAFQYLNISILPFLSSYVLNDLESTRVFTEYLKAAFLFICEEK